MLRHIAPLAVLLFLAAGQHTTCAQEKSAASEKKALMVVRLADGQIVQYDVSQLAEVTFIETEEHGWVDLGLPSGTLWATCNVGAKSEEEGGHYFSWGEADTKATYDWNTYRHADGSFYTLTKYCTDEAYGTPDGKTELDPEDDAATALWGNAWQMPTESQLEELVDEEYTIAYWWTLPNGINGLYITSKTNYESLFLPAGGYMADSSVQGQGTCGEYSSRSVAGRTTYWASILYFDREGAHPSQNYGSRAAGRHVRAVRKK